MAQPSGHTTAENFPIPDGVADFWVPSQQGYYDETQEQVDEQTMTNVVAIMSPVGERQVWNIGQDHESCKVAHLPACRCPLGHTEDANCYTHQRVSDARHRDLTDESFCGVKPTQKHY
jgi:hypothetical protein